LVKMAEAARDEALQLATDLQVENDKMVDQVMKLQAAVESAEWTKIELNKELAQARSVLEENREAYRQLLARVDRPGKPTPKSSPILAKKVFAVPKVKAK
jgi:predicted translin family RNA/ssDNA-binding protein